MANVLFKLGFIKKPEADNLSKKKASKAKGVLRPMPIDEP